MEAHSSREPDPPAPTARARSRPDPFLITCRCFSVITALAAVLCIAVNILSAVHSFSNGTDIFDGIFRCYTVVIASFVVVAETEWEFIMKFSKCDLLVESALCLRKFAMPCSGILGRQRNAADLVLLSIHSRAASMSLHLCLALIFFSSVAVMTRAYPEYLKDREELFLLQSISSYILLACGVVYFLSGMFCIGMVKRARQKKEVSREQAIKDLGWLEPMLSFVCIMLFLRITNVAQTNNCRSLSGVEKNLRHCWSLAKLDSELERG
ncbi:hypothetical protein SASPL_134362 [Salvia splendens]|uniref:Transmembrane protein n=1 Tax=Salvia splendens TaxID=180675 RepID=A0A8X8ZJC9_SALSN|nr:hypothetical protein SASPL_134362 [Salvia splendens]